MDERPILTSTDTADGQAPGPAGIQLKIVHGHLAFAKYPVLVGHYNGDTFAGAEAQLDRALGDKLSQRRSLGLYPGPLGTNTIILDDAQRPRGAIVVGLGEAASLSLGGLRRTLRQGILALAAAEIDRRALMSDANTDAAEVSVNFSALMVGSGDGGLDRTTCVTALLQAGAQAQSILAETKGLEARLGSVEIIELLEYRAFAVLHVVNDLLATQSNLRKLFDFESELGKRKGGRRRVHAGPDKSWWEPIQISMSETADGQRSLAFATSAGMARTELRTIAADLEMVTPLMRRATKSNAPDAINATPGRALFELLWPSSLKDRSTEERNRRLILDEKSAQFPWELLDDRRPWAEDGQSTDKQEPPAVRNGMVRQLLQSRFQQRVIVPVDKPKALIIGNPRGAPLPESLPNLDEAEAEAIAIRNLLKKTHDVTLLTDREATPENVCEALFAQAWEIVHIAAHGVVRTMMADPDGRMGPMTGILLGGGVVLGPSVLSKMPVSPGLFFLNCCHIGRVDPAAEDQAQLASLAAQPEFAASMAVQLIRNGVRAVVAAGWAVQDTAARIFAEKFYDAMLNRSRFGYAISAARRDAYESNPTGTTWGAYQCYGEPDFAFPTKHTRSRSERSTSQDGGIKFIACVEAIAAAERLGDDVNIGLERNAEAQRARIERIEQASAKWFDNGELRVALADAYGDLCNLPKAIEHYEAARTGFDSQYKMRAIEQLANLKARHAAIAFRASPAKARDLPETITRIEEARKLIETLIEVLGPTPERRSIEGGCWKRLAQVDESRADQLLERMAKAYQQAADCRTGARAGDAVTPSYPPLMVSAARLVAGLRTGQGLDQVSAGITEAMASFSADDSEDFWQLIEVTDVRMMMAMAAGSITATDAAEILSGYLTAWKHVGSPRMLMSVVEQLVFLEDTLKTGSQETAPKRSAIVASVRRIRTGFRPVADIWLPTALIAE